ncbi:TrmH family RNA methyltransferase [Puia dinghuensis]|uniref:RNA methyltransferase n=1 Tax=Puia dinghuensis TaxID=1792502 RepID=A0A8J2U995_9BACT|nr:RNA methyltransferase [Puia dinghuensis]GGA87892.1 RNA methyltransferase [Puia dinghuensis]
MPITKSQVKYIQSLGHKKFRDTEGVFVVEGPKLTDELLRAPGMRPRVVYALPEWINALPVATRHGLMAGPPDVSHDATMLRAVEPAELERLSLLSTPNQVIAVFEKPVFPPPVLDKGIHLVLDGIQDPGNMGTIVRLADWFGIGTVLCSPDSADVFNPKAVQSTMGSISRVQVLYEEPGAAISASGLPVYAALLEGERLYGIGRITRGWIVIGNESKGIRPELQGLATHRVTIPRIGSAESLNAAVATGIILSHLVGG